MTYYKLEDHVIYKHEKLIYHGPGEEVLINHQVYKVLTIIRKVGSYEYNLVPYKLSRPLHPGEVQLMIDRGEV